MIAQVESQISDSVAEFMNSDNRMVRLSWDTGWNMPLQDEMRKAYDTQVFRVAQLMKHYANRNPSARHAVEMFATQSADINDPSAHLTPREDRLAAKAVRRVVKMVRESRLPQPIAAEFIHTVSDFPTLTLACVRRQLQRLSEEGNCNDECFDDVFAQLPSRDICEQTGKLGLMPIKAPLDAGCPETLDGKCTTNYWRFGEMTRGDFRSYLYRDSVKWSWLLGQCAQYGGWTDEVVAWILRIQEDRRIAGRASLLGDENGLNTGIFNNTNQNLLIGTDGICNPNVTCAAEAVYVLQNFAKQWAEHIDQDGQRTCQRQFKLITGDWDVHCAFTKALEAEITEKSQITDGGVCISEIETTAPACFPDIDPCYSRDLREQLGDASEGAFFIIPYAEGGLTGKNVFEEADITGFETTQLAQRVPAWQTLGGRPLRQYGSDHCFNTEVLAIRGYGLGVSYAELAFASDGSEACPPGYTPA